MKRLKKLRKEGGAYTVFTAILMTVLIGFLAMSIDIGYHYYRGAQLQNAADAAATAVASSLNVIDETNEEIAYRYLAKNGFADRNRVHCSVEVKGETTYETIETEDYIKAGYYKLTVWVDDKTFFASVLDIDSLSLKKVSYVKAKPNYVRIPEALNYTVFAGSTKGTPSNPALQINGKTGFFANTVTGFMQDSFNFMNKWVVKPIQSIQFSFPSWRPSTWSVWWDDTKANSENFKFNTSKLTTSGDVHSNSNIESNIGSINANRIQDTDFEHTLSAADLAKYFEITPIEDVPPSADDYGQVTFDAVKEITFKAPQGASISGGEIRTYYYVQNQQYLEQTQAALRIIDLIDFKQLTASNFQQLYEAAATDYFKLYNSVTPAQKKIITNMVADGKLEYEASTKAFKLKDQTNIIYSVNRSQANAALDVAEKQGLGKMLFGQVEGVDGTYSKGIALVNDGDKYGTETTGNDKRYKDYTTTLSGSGVSSIPYYAVRDSSDGSKVAGDEYDKLGKGDIDETLYYYQYDDDGDLMENNPKAVVNVLGDVINREYQDIQKKGTSILDATSAGAEFAIARTFIENSDYIEMPNLRPYFIRQINRSIKNATKTRELINRSDAGQPTIRYAARERTWQLQRYLGTRCANRDCDQEKPEGSGDVWVCSKCGTRNKILSYYDATYGDSNVYRLEDNTVLFRNFKRTSKNSGITELGNTAITYNSSGRKSYNYTVSISKNSYKNFKLYKTEGDIKLLKSPADFISSYQDAGYNERNNKVNNTENNKYAQDAIVQFKADLLNNNKYKDPADATKINPVAAKKAELTDTTKYSEFIYSNEADRVKDVIESVTKPNITTQGGTITPKVSITQPVLPNVFLGYGTTGSGTVISRTEGQRKIFDDFIKNLGVTVNTDTFTAPSLPSIATSGGKDAGGSGNKKDLYLDGTYKNVSTPYTWPATRYNIRVSATANVTGNIKVDNEIGLYVESGGTLKVGGKFYTDGGSKSKLYVRSGGTMYIKGNIESMHDKTYIEVAGYLQVGGDIKTQKSGVTDLSGTKDMNVTVKNGGILVVNGSILGTMRDYINVEAGGTLIVQGQCQASGSSSGQINVYGTLIQLNGSNAVDSNNINVYSGGIVGSVGGLNSDHTIYIQGGYIYTLGNISGLNNADNGNDIIEINGSNAEVYVRGVITTTNSKADKRHIYIHNGTNNTLSILGQGYSDCFDGKCNQIHAANDSSGNKIYLGKSTSITGDGSAESIINGSICCYGNLTFNTSGKVTFTGNGESYITGDLDVTSTSEFVVSNGQKLYVVGNIKVRDITVDNAEVHATEKITASNMLKLLNGGLLEGIGGVTAKSYDTNGGEFNSAKTITFSGDITANSMAEGYVKTGDVTATSLTLNNVALKIDGDLTLTNDIVLNNNSVLYITGNVLCNGITLNKSKLFVDGNIGSASRKTTFITLNDGSNLLNRKGNVVNSIYSSVYCSGAITANQGSWVYAEGEVTTLSVSANGSSNIFAYRAMFLGAGSVTVNGNASEVFCGSNSKTTSSVSLSASGSFFYPYVAGASLSCNAFHIYSGGKVVFSGLENKTTCNITASDGAVIDSGGILYNPGKTVFTSSYLDNSGKAYMIGGTDYTNAKRRGNQKVDKKQRYYCDIIFGSGSETYLGKSYNGSTAQANFSFSSQYEARGDVYFDCGVTVSGSIPTGEDNRDSYGNIIPLNDDGVKANISGNPKDYRMAVAVYIPRGMTYMTGSMTTPNNTMTNITAASDAGAFEGMEYGGTHREIGLFIGGSYSAGGSIFNNAKLIVLGSLNLPAFSSDNRYTVKYTYDKTAGFIGGKQDAGISLKNGMQEGSNGHQAIFFIGGGSSVIFPGYVRNYGTVYMNSAVDVRGWEANYYGKLENGVDLDSDVAWVNLAGAQAHLNGAVRLNSNVFINKWPSNGRDAIFACNGKFTFGRCVYNAGTFIANGDVTNNEGALTVNSNDGEYRANKNFSVMNGVFDVTKLNSNYSGNIYPNARFFCGGTLQVGVDEVGGSSKEALSGSAFNAGTMYVKKDFYVYCNSKQFSWDALASFDLAGFFNNKNSRSYFRTAIWLLNNSNTFVGGDCMGGGGTAIGEDTIFMVGGDFRSKRAAKVGIDIYANKRNLIGEILEYGDKDEPKSPIDSDYTYSSCYVYVGKNMFVNTIGSTTESASGQTILNKIGWSDSLPYNGSRDMDIYANTNMYVGGSLYANSKVIIRECCSIMIGGQGTGFFNNSGSINSFIYSATGDLSVPEKLANKLAVNNQLNSNKDCRFYVYQSFDMMPNSSLVVGGAMQVNETAKIRDMTKTYVYGTFQCGKYVEIGKSLDGRDSSAIVEYNSSGKEVLARDSSNNYKYITNKEKQTIANSSESTFVNNYNFSRSAYMFVNGDFTSGQDFGSGVLGFFDTIRKWMENTMFSTGYTKVYASSELKVNGNILSNRYITLRHDAKVYCAGNMEAATSIEGAIYSEWYVGGNMNAATSWVTKVFDSLLTFVNSKRGKIEMFDQVKCIVGGNMYSSASIDIGEYVQGTYFRGRKPLDQYSVVAEGSTDYYKEGDDYGEAMLITREGDQYYDMDGTKLTRDGGTMKYENGTEFGSTKDVKVYWVEYGYYYYFGDNYELIKIDMSDGDTDDAEKPRGADGNDGIATTDEEAYGAEVFIQGSMIGLNGHIKEYAYTVSVVGGYVYAPDYITLRSNSDLWILPETFNADTYQFLPWSEFNDMGDSLWAAMKYYLGQLRYNFVENNRFKEGSAYTFGSLTVNKNASFMGTHSLLQLSSLTQSHADGSALSSVEKFIKDTMGGLFQRKVVLREDSLVLFGKDISIVSAPLSLSLDFLKGNESWAGFDSKGNATSPGYQYKCTNNDLKGEHKGYNYTMTFTSPQTEDFPCDVCGKTINHNKYKITQISHPAVMYAGNNLDIATTIDMQMTYLVADQGNVDIQNFYTKTKNEGNNLKELPNAISSFTKNITYNAWVGQLSSLFYAPLGNITFDGIYTDIYGSVVGNTIKMNAYYQNFHRFNNWRTMDLHIAENGYVYIINEKMWNEAPPLGDVFDLSSDSKYENKDFGVRIFF